MGTSDTAGATGTPATQEEVLVNFASLMKERYKARIFLFGSRARGTHRPNSDYDVVAVARRFGSQPILGRAPDRGDLWRQAGGWRKGLDLNCYTPTEFRRQCAGLGYVHHALSHGELIEIAPE